MIRKTTAIALAAILATGCTTSAGQNRAGDRSPAGQALHVSLAKDYTDLSSLQKDSAAVVRASLVGTEKTRIKDIPGTVTTMRISQIVSGVVPTETISILQVGQNGMILEDTSKMMKHGRDYLIFLSPYHRIPGDNTGLYIITGEKGLYQYDDDTATFRYAGGHSKHLPAFLKKQTVDSLEFLKR